MNDTNSVRIIVLGVLLLQFGWVLAVPPFRGMDEWDHVYRAAAVAEGQWRAEPASATRGTGAVVEVPEKIVLVANKECIRLPYTGPAECEGVAVGNGLTSVASGAGRYHPLFYAVTGYLSLPFEGVARLYAMRAISLAMCLGLFFLALGAIRRWATGTGVWIATAIGLTPTVVYTTTVVAPNGVEIMAGFTLWAALIGLAVAREGTDDRYFLVLVSIAGPLLATVRSLGPLWLILIFAAIVVAFPVRRDRVVALLGRPLGLAAALLVLLGVGGSAWWAVSQRALEVGVGGGSLTGVGRLEETSLQLPLWPLQMIGAFPYRDQPAPPWVYACWILLGGSLLWVALRASTGRFRWALVMGLLTTMLVPVLITLVTIESYGTAWQGRYGLPFSLGVLLLAGLAWDRVDHRVGARIWVPGLVLFVAGSTLGPVAVLRSEMATGPWSSAPGWPAPPPTLLAMLVVVAASVIWLTAVKAPPADRKAT